ncbi:MAG: RagB/SusD family nutrient uptake outer membrane protein [Pedobacter sp.]|nr:MAG: RagB/SusD family nutrient uptake outer membrane protein [Pedobacter sp.]
MKKIFNKKLLLILVVLCLGSCKKALEETPYSFITPEQIGDSEEAVNLWVNGVRSTFLKDGFFRFEIFNRPYETDSDDATGSAFAFEATGAGNFASNEDIRHYWTSLYLLIARSNHAIPFIEKMESVNQDIKNNAIGELNFYKGWAYFTLVRAYGGVPLIKESVVTNQKINVPRSSIADTYAYIIETLKLAENQLLPRTSAAYKVGTISNETAKTMLAKVYLNIASSALPGGSIKLLGGPQKSGTTRIPPVEIIVNKTQVAGFEKFDPIQYFTLARDKAKEVIDMASPGYLTVADKTLGLFRNWNDVWSKSFRGRGEHLWMVYSIAGQSESGMVLTFQYNGQTNARGEILNGTGFYGLSDHWYDLFDSSDRRVRDGVIHKWLTANATGAPTRRWYPQKEVTTDPDSIAKFGYEAGYNWASSDQVLARVTKFSDVADRTQRRSDAPYPFLRYAETLLIYAEAANEVTGAPTADAVAKVNFLRQRSYAPPVNIANYNRETFRSLVLEERRRELALEGNRQWDLRRWGIYLPVMNAMGRVDANNIVKAREPRHLLWPLPLTEMDGNEAILENNPGW